MHAYPSFDDDGNVIADLAGLTVDSASLLIEFLNEATRKITNKLNGLPKSKTRSRAEAENDLTHLEHFLIDLIDIVEQRGAAYPIGPVECFPEEAAVIRKALTLTLFNSGTEKEKVLELERLIDLFTEAHRITRDKP